MKSEPSRDFLDRAIRFSESHNGQRLIVSAFSIGAVLILLAFPGSILAYVFGLPLIFFVPGFALVRLFFWKGTSVEAKFVLSLGMSILVVILLGLLLTLSPIGLMSSTTQASLIIFALGAIAIEARWLHADRVGKGVPPIVSEPKEEESGGKMDKVVVAMIATALVISAISFGLIVTAKYPSRTYFAMTDENGSADINVTQKVGGNITLVLHVKNGESGTRTFTILFQNWNSTALGSWNVSQAVQKGDYWNHTAKIHLPLAGTFRLDFKLYIQEPGKAAVEYGELHLWIAVG
jgi:uncharacterized membrane protein